MAIQPRTEYSPPEYFPDRDRTRADFMPHPSTEELEALFSHDPREMLLSERVFAPDETHNLTNQDVSLGDKARLVSRKCCEYPVFQEFARQHGIDPEAPNDTPQSPLNQPERLVEVGATYAANEQRVMRHLANRDFFDSLPDAAIIELCIAKDAADIEGQARLVEVMASNFTLTQQRIRQLRAPEVLHWIRETDPESAQIVDSVAKPDLEDYLMLLETKTAEFEAVQREQRRQQAAREAAEKRAAEARATEASRAAELEVKRLQKETEEADRILDLLTERDGALNAYLLTRKKEPVDTDALIDKEPLHKVLEILDNEYSSPQFQKYLKKLPNSPAPTDDKPNPVGLPMGNKKIPRPTVIFKTDDRNFIAAVGISGQRIDVTAQELAETIALHTSGVTQKLHDIRDSKVAAQDSVQSYLEQLKKGVANASPQQLVAALVTTAALAALSSPLTTHENEPARTANEKALIFKQPEMTANTPPAAANAAPAVPAPVTIAPSELPQVAKAYEALSPDVLITKTTKPAAIIWAREIAMSRTASASAALNAREASLESKPESQRGVQLIDQAALLSLEHITRGKLHKSDVASRSQELSTIMLFARHPDTVYKDLVNQRLHQIKPGDKFEADMARLISTKLLRGNTEYTKAQKRLMGVMLAKAVGASVGENAQHAVLQDLRKKVTMLNPPPKVERAPVNHGHIAYHQVSPQVGYGMSKKARRIYKKILVQAGKKYNVDPNFIAAFYYLEHGHGDTASGTPVDGKGKWRDPPPPYGHGSAYASSSVGASGPGQFMPGTWAAYGVDANGDGIKNKQDLKDAVYGQAKYLAATGGTKGTSEAKLRNAAWHYNHSGTYVQGALNVYYSLKRHQKQANQHVKRLKAHQLRAARATTQEVAPAPAVPPVIIPTAPEAVVSAPEFDAAAVTKAVARGARNIKERAAAVKKKEMVELKKERRKQGKEIAQEALEQLNKFRGRDIEASGEFKKFTHGRSEAWCADFVSWVLRETGNEFKGGPALKNGDIPAVINVVSWFKQKGMHFTPNSEVLEPHPGDIIAFGLSTHIGVVTRVDGDWVEFVAGNASGNAIRKRGLNYKTYGGRLDFGRLK